MHVLCFFSENRKKKKRLPKARNGLHLLRKERSRKLLLITYKKKGITNEKWRNKVSKKRGKKRVRLNLFFHLFVFGA